MKKIFSIMLFAAFIAGPITLIFEGCKKTDSLFASPKEDRQLTSEFFSINATEDPVVKKIADAIYGLNIKTPFVADFARVNGLPKWNKSIISLRSNANSFHREAGGGDSLTIDTIVSVPLVLTKGTQVNGCIIGKIKNDSVYLRYVLAQDYKAYPHTGSRKITKVEDFAAFMFVLNKKVFGHKEFTLTDDSLFLNAFSASRDSIIRTVSFDSSYNMSRLNIPATSCVTLIIGVCDTKGHNLQRTTKDPNCLLFYDERCYTLYDDEGGGGSIGGNIGGGSTGGTTGGTVPGGGGGGNTSPIPHSYPCPTSGSCNPPSGGIGWFPTVPFDDEFNPYEADDVIIDTSISNNFPCVERITDSLADYVNINALSQVALKTIFGVNKKIKLTIVADPTLPSDVDGATDPGEYDDQTETYITTLRLNKWVLQNSTEEFIAAVILHESIHAYISYCYQKYHAGLMDSTTFKQMFPLYWPPKSVYFANNLYYYQMGQTPDHKAMAASMINLLVQPLIKLFPNNSIRKSLRDSIYEAISWGGLYGTPSWKVRTDTLFLNAMYKMSKDTSVHAPFPLQGFPSMLYQYDSHNTNLTKGCQ